MESIVHVPRHVAIIMDGNGRWAQQRGLPRLKGHEAGVNNVRLILECLESYQVKYVTMFAFSTENWNRPLEEVEGLFHILETRIEEEARALNEKGVRMVHLGRSEELPDTLQDSIIRATELTKNNQKLVLGLALNYGGRAEIVDATKRIIKDGIAPDRVTEELFSQYLYATEFPDVDLLIRTGGELRISNFLMWQTAYSELYFTDVLWPDFDKKETEKALLAYSKRQRRFGGL